MFVHRLTLAALLAAASLGNGAIMPNDIRLMGPSLVPAPRPPRPGKGFAAAKRAAQKRRNVLRNRAMHRGASKRHG